MRFACFKLPFYLITTSVLISCIPNETVQVQEPAFASALYVDLEGSPPGAPIIEYKESPGERYFIKLANDTVAYRKATEVGYFAIVDGQMKEIRKYLYIPTNFKLSEYFYPDGWMGGFNKMGVSKFNCPSDANHSPTETCLNWTAQRANNNKFAGVFYLRDKNWGWRAPAYQYQGGGKYVTFWARSKKGCQPLSQFQELCNKASNKQLNCRSVDRTTTVYCPSLQVKIGGLATPEAGALEPSPDLLIGDNLHLPLFSEWRMYAITIPDTIGSLKISSAGPYPLLGAFSFYRDYDHMPVDDTLDFYLDDVQYRNALPPNVTPLLLSPDTAYQDRLPAKPPTQAIFLPLPGNPSSINIKKSCLFEPDTLACNALQDCINKDDKLSCKANAYWKKTLSVPADPAQALTRATQFADAYRLCNLGTYSPEEDDFIRKPDDCENLKNLVDSK